MHAMAFIQDLAVIMLIAGLVTVVFNRIRQPVVLGYILAGLVIGPYTPPFELIHDRNTIDILAEIGVIFLLFSLGLEFSLRKLARVGATAIVAALAEIVLMLWVGYEIGRYFNWKPMDSLFLGAMLAVSSTTIIIKALDELKLKKERFAQLIFGILIVEDILAIGMIALLSGVAATGTVETGDVLVTVGKLVLFMVVSLVVGLITVPRVLDYVARSGSYEILLIAVLGICFGFCLLVIKLGYSVALGAFLIGAIMAESRQLHTIEKLVMPLKDMFSAIFFVAIGLLLDPAVLVEYAGPVAVITAAVVLGKVVSCGTGAFLAGNDGRTSLKVGMGLAQIGEFSFIIASLGLTLKVTSDFLYPVAVAVSAVTTLLTPYLIKAADPVSERLARVVPSPIARLFGFYTRWLQSLELHGDRAQSVATLQRILLRIAVNLCVIAAIFMGGAYLVNSQGSPLVDWIGDSPLEKTLVWGGALLLSLPGLLGVYSKIKTVSMMLVELGTHPGSSQHGIYRIISELIPIASMGGILLLMSALSASILPPFNLLVLVLIGAALLCALWWRSMVRLHLRLQAALRDTMAQDKAAH